jgi:hypothetical protein
MNLRKKERGAAAPGRNRRLSLRTIPGPDVAVTCRKGSRDRGPNVAAALLECSQDGARLLVREAMREGDEVSLTWTRLPYLRPLKRVGAVRWVAPAPGGGFCAGVQFGKRLSYDEFVRLVRP